MKREFITNEDSSYLSGLREVRMEHGIALDDTQVNLLREDVEGIIIEN